MNIGMLSDPQPEKLTKMASVWQLDLAKVPDTPVEPKRRAMTSAFGEEHRERVGSTDDAVCTPKRVMGGERLIQKRLLMS